MRDRIYYSREAEERAARERAVMTIVMLALGIGIGAVLALLFAPKSGEKTRGELASTLEESLENGREATMTVLERLEKGVAELGKKLEERLGERH